MDASLVLPTPSSDQPLPAVTSIFLHVAPGASAIRVEARTGPPIAPLLRVTGKSRWGWCIVDEGGRERLHYLMSGDRGRDRDWLVKQPGIATIEVVDVIGTHEPP